MPATFILSFDCEGKWGVADHLDAILRAKLTNANLDITYEKLLALLGRYGIKATFAFVGAFTMSIDEYYGKKNYFQDIRINEKSWLSNFQQDAERNNFEGWLNPTPCKMVIKAGVHEIAAHGFTHIPLGEAFVTKEEFSREMEALRMTAVFSNLKNMTFIYPRNIIGHLEELKKWGYIGYRDILMSQCFGNSMLAKKIEKARWFLNELNPNIRAQSHPQSSNLICIPSGYFLNHRFGFRKYIPLEFTLVRWKNLLENAIKNNKVIHLYTHPHNFLTGDRMYFLLELILRDINSKMTSNKVVNLTQKEYVDNLY